MNQFQINHFYQFTLFLLVTGLMLTSCNEDELADRPYPSLDTKAVSAGDMNGVMLSAEFLSLGTNGVSDHGFVYDDNSIPTIELSERISLGSVSEVGEFSGLANRNMVRNRRYSARAYAISEANNITVYGQVVQFISLGSVRPEILDFYPKHGMVGDIITIVGTGFSNVARDNRVKFGPVFAETLEASKDTIRCTVPEFTAPGENDLSVTVAQQTGIAVEKFELN